VGTATEVAGYRLDGTLCPGRLGPVQYGIRQEDGLAVVVHLTGPVAGPVRWRFLDQARDLMEIPPHRRLWPVLDAGVSPDGACYLVTARAAGSLADWLAAAGPLPEAEAVAVAVSAASGLDALHAAGLLHGNITPANLLATADGAVVVTGMALPALTDTGPGPNPAHRPPEVLRGADWTAAADVYALASTLFTLLAGQPPYGASGSDRDRLLRALTEPVPEPDRPDLLAGVREALRCGLAKEPADRPATPGAFAALLTAARLGPAGSAPAVATDQLETLPPTAPVPPAPPIATMSSAPTSSPDTSSPAATSPLETESPIATIPPTATVPPTPRENGRPLGSQYLLDEPIGRGATGQVWRARRRADGTPVAVKVLRSELAEDPDTVVRFLRERTTLLRLNNPHLVRVHDLVAEGDTLAIVMDLVEGPDLRQLAVRAPMSPVDAVAVLAQVADALAAVHAAGVIHRDLKPENVLVERPSGQIVARLTDFGIARVTGATALTRLTQIVGTPAYLAPELVANRPATPAVDVYAFGVLAYELLAGHRPFEADNPAALLRAHLDDSPARPPDLSDPMWTLVAGCLAKDPAVRPTAQEVARTLPGLFPPVSSQPDHAAWHRGFGFSAAGAGEPAAPALLLTATGTAPPPTAPPAPAQRGRRPWRLVLAVALVVVLGVTLGVVLAARNRPLAPPTASPTPSTILVPVAAAAFSRHPGEVTLSFPFSEASDLPGFRYYVVRQDETLRPNPVRSTPHTIRGLDTTTWYCFTVAALVVTAEPVPRHSRRPVCKVANGR
jgi:serine/threonine protein kinase